MTNLRAFIARMLLSRSAALPDVLYSYAVVWNLDGAFHRHGICAMAQTPVDAAYALRWQRDRKLEGGWEQITPAGEDLLLSFVMYSGGNVWFLTLSIESVAGMDADKLPAWKLPTVCVN